MSSTSPNIMLHLLRKESRQLVPLIAILASLALVFQFLGLINGEISNRLGEVALLGMPSLFAVGCNRCPFPRRRWCDRNCWRHC
jgi:hypothetical protein